MMRSARPRAAVIEGVALTSQDAVQNGDRRTLS
jgi:hypothetical protein